MDIDDDYDDDYIGREASLNEEKMIGETAREALTRLELDLAYSSEKILNLEILLMQVSGRANDYEALNMESEDISTECLEMAFEFDLLSGILTSEVKELDSFILPLWDEIADTRQKLSQCHHFEESSTELEMKLCDAEESLKQSQDLVADLRMQAMKFERTLAFGQHETYEETENGHEPSFMSAKWKLQTMEQQRHVLQMLEKSLARELDLEKKLSDARYNGEELKMKLHYAEQEADCMEESMEIIMDRMFEADIAAELLMGISKELTGKFQILQFNLNGAIHRECEMKSKLQESMMKMSAADSALEKLKIRQAEVDSLLVCKENSPKDNLKASEDKYAAASSEALILRKKIMTLEGQLRESESQLQLAKASVEVSEEQQSLLHSELNDLKNVTEALRENVLKTESRAQSEEAKCQWLTKTNMELNEELDFLRNNETDKTIILEGKLKESDTQLEQAKASVEALEEQQNMLNSALSDMEILITDLKGKVSKAESRAETAEYKCILLAETNLELNEELGFLRGSLDCLETSLCQADNAKIATAKDIGIKTKIITDLVMKLALEREHLQLQISALAKKNKILAEKCLKPKNSTVNHKGTNTGNELSFLKSSVETLTEFSTTNFQVKSSTAMAACKTDVETTVSTDEDSSAVVSKLETVRTIDATQLNSNYIVMAFAAVLVSIFAIYLFELENRYD